MFSLLALESYPLLQPLLFFRDWRDDNVTIEKKIIFVKNYHLFNLKKKKIPSPLCFLFLCFVLVCSSSATLPERKREKEKKKESLCNL